MAKIPSVRAFNLTVLGIVALGMGYYFYDQIRAQTHDSVAKAVLIASGIATLFGLIGLIGIDSPTWIVATVIYLTDFGSR